MTPELREWAEDHGYFYYAIACPECGAVHKGWTDTGPPERCAECGAEMEPKEEPGHAKADAGT